MVTTPEQVALGVYRIDAVGFSNAISVFLLADDDGWALVDTGVKGSAKRIREALISLEAGPGELKRIFLTHHHPDHIGGLAGVREWAPDAGVVASEHEGEVISGRRAPEDPSNALFRSIAKRLPFPTSPVDQVAREVENFAGFRVISTPGHSLGHTSLLRDEDGVLLTGDAFGCLPRKIRVGERKFLCADPAGAKRSAEKLLTEEFTTVAFSHGKTLRQDARERLREVTAANHWA